MALDGGGIDGGGIDGGGIDAAETLAAFSFCDAGASGVPSLPEFWVGSSAGAGG